jgi:hypothetical protein
MIEKYYTAGGFLLMALLVMACNNDEAAPGNYILFKVDGKQITFADRKPVIYTVYDAYTQCSIRTDGATPDQYSTMTIQFYDKHDNHITAEDILSWTGKDLPIFNNYSPNSNIQPSVNFLYYLGRHDDYRSGLGSGPGDGVHITSVEPDGTYGTRQIFKVSGTFQCMVVKPGSAVGVRMDEGEFVIRITDF